MPCLPMFYAFLSSRLTIRVTCSHAYMMLLTMPCGDLCVLCVYFHAIWLDPCLHMFICLDSCSSMSMCQVPICLHAYMSRSMFFTCLRARIYVLYMFYAIFHVFMRFMPCLCA